MEVVDIEEIVGIVGGKVCDDGFDIVVIVGELWCDIGLFSKFLLFVIDIECCGCLEGD